MGNAGNTQGAKFGTSRAWRSVSDVIKEVKT